MKSLISFTQSRKVSIRNTVIVRHEVTLIFFFFKVSAIIQTHAIKSAIKVKKIKDRTKICWQYIYFP